MNDPDSSLNLAMTSDVVPGAGVTDPPGLSIVIEQACPDPIVW